MCTEAGSIVYIYPYDCDWHSNLGTSVNASKIVQYLKYRQFLIRGIGIWLLLNYACIVR